MRIELFTLSIFRPLGPRLILTVWGTGIPEIEHIVSYQYPPGHTLRNFYLKVQSLEGTVQELSGDQGSYHRL